MLIDTHTHLSDPKFEGEVEAVIERAKEAGVNLMINPSTNLADAHKMQEIVNKYEEVYGMVGIYPGEAGKTQDWKADLAKLKELILTDQKIIAIGEVGLDITPYTENPSLEEEVFESQLRMAIELDKPVVIHTRGTAEPMRKILEKYDKLPRGHFHCFSGTPEWLDYVLSRGFYVGFDGNVTYKSAGDLRELVALVPTDRLLLETDSPYLPPEGMRGQRNEPGNVRITATAIAKLRGVSLESLAEATTANAKKLFDL